MAGYRKKSEAQFSFQRVRAKIYLLGLFFLACFGLILGRAFLLASGDHTRLAKIQNTQYNRKIPFVPRRGDIYDAKGETLAIDKEVDSISAYPHLIKEKKKFAIQVAKILKKPWKRIYKKINQPKKKFVWLERRVDRELSQKIKNLKLKGIGYYPEFKRFYPNNQLASNLMGMVGYDAKALGGLEYDYDSYLKVRSDPIILQVDAYGRILNSHILLKQKKPRNIKLTLDKSIQYHAERELSQTVKKYRAKGGIILVMENDTGAILAMASSPTFDPNRYNKFPRISWNNKVITDAYEPGSTFKIFTAAAALKFLKWTPKTKMDCENGSYKVGKHTINDTHGYGKLSLSKIIKKSSNICSFKMGQQVGKKRFLAFLRSLGFGRRSNALAMNGSHLSGAKHESAGIMLSNKKTSNFQLGNIAFGQGISVTPLQLVTAYASIGNGGKLMKPYVVDSVMDYQGRVIKKSQPQVIKNIFSEKEARTLVELLRGVVEKGGTGTRARVSGYSVGGKTGTAQKVIEGRKGYAKGKYIASFIGLAPLDNPKITVLVSIDEPKGEYYGGLVSAPVFARVTKYTLAYLGVPLESESIKVARKEKVESKLDNSSTTILMDELLEVNSGSESIQMSQVNKTSKKENREIVPNLKGLTMREVIRRLDGETIKYHISGSGYLVKQNPKPGKKMNPSTVLKLSFEPKR